MDILKVKHIDFSLIVSCKELLPSFLRSKERQKDFMHSTYYGIPEGEAFLLNVESGEFEKLISGAKSHPIFFENKDYFFNIYFVDKDALTEEPIVDSRLKSVTSKFHYASERGILTGVLHFENDLGSCDVRIKYAVGKRKVILNISFEVFPTKLSFRADYVQMLRDIEKYYPQLAMDFLKKTFTLFKPDLTVVSDLIWWQIFSGIYKDFIHSSLLIVNNPHRKLIKEINYFKADRIKKWTNELEEEYYTNQYHPHKLYRIASKTLDKDTPENRFFKYALLDACNKFSFIRKYIRNHYKSRISKEFSKLMDDIDEDLQKIANHPFFKNVGTSGDLMQNSLVLQKAVGYSTFYKNWLMLRKGFSLLESVQRIEVKNVAELYQFWCFFEIKNIIEEIIGKSKPDDIILGVTEVDGLVHKIKRGEVSKLVYVINNKEKIELFHDLSIGDDFARNGLRSYTGAQRPDIVLKIKKNELIDEYEMTYLYDAKYQVDSVKEGGDIDYPPESSINQMHRYRDAIYSYNSESSKPEKEIVGGFVLFPGQGKADDIVNAYFFKAIEKINIGALPMLPSNKSGRELIKTHLRKLLSTQTAEMFDAVIPHKSAKYEAADPEVLIGIVSSDLQKRYFSEGEDLVYHTGRKKPRLLSSNLRYFAPYISGKGICEYFEILEYRLESRAQIFDKTHYLYNGKDNSERLVLRLGKRRVIKNGEYFTCRITLYEYTRLSSIRCPVNGKIELKK